MAVLLASELVTNSVRHSGSAVPGGRVTVSVAAGQGGVRVGVADHSGESTPVLRPAALEDGEGSRGMGARGRLRCAVGLLAGRRVRQYSRLAEPGRLVLACTCR